MENLEQMENQISVIEESHKMAIMSVHENVEKLINDCVSIEVYEDDKKSYDTAVELKRIVKNTHVSIEKKRKDLKQPLIDYGKRLDEFVKTIYEPLKKAELIVKGKMEAYELRQEKLKNERREIEAENQRKKDIIESNLKSLQGQLEKINLAKTKQELDVIVSYLDTIDLKEFGDSSADAGFILNQLKMTSTMAYRLLDSQAKIVELDKSTLGEPIPEVIPEAVIEIAPEVIPEAIVEVAHEVIPEAIPEVVVESPIVEPSFDWDNPTEETLTFEEPSVAIPNVSENDNFESIFASETAQEKPIENKSLSDDDFLSIIDNSSLEISKSVEELIGNRLLNYISMNHPKVDVSVEIHKSLVLETCKRISVILSNK